MAKKAATLKSVETIKHDADKRKNIPTAEHQSVLKQDEATPKTAKYPIHLRTHLVEPNNFWEQQTDNLNSKEP